MQLDAQHLLRFGASLDGVATLADDVAGPEVPWLLGATKAAEPAEALTRAQVDTELRTLLDSALAEPSHAAHRRIADLVELPAELRSVDPVRYAERSIGELIDAGDSGAYELRRELASLRLSYDALDTHLAHPRTREQLTDELVHTLLAPNDLLSPDDVRRLAIIERMPSSVRPPLPPRYEGWDFARVHLDGAYVACTFADRVASDIRALAMPRSNVTLDDVLRRAATADGGVDYTRIATDFHAQVRSAGTDALERAGIDDRVLLLQALRRADEGTRWHIETATSEAKEIAAAMRPRSDAEAVLVDGLRQHLGQTVGKLERSYSPGYLVHIDFQHRGGAVAAAELLAALSRDARAVAKPAEGMLAW